ncbi:MAG: hypothetical protein JWO48_381, partial [Bryobacterales bacterium]|nr:hypothetical protein [Bryobacterales bacterium]
MANRVSFAALAALGLVTALGPAAAAFAAPDSQAQYFFKQQYTVGREYNVLFSDSIDIKYDVINRGRAIDEASISVSSQIKGKITILETENGVPTSERIAFDKSSGVVVKANRKEPDMQRAQVAGRTVTVHRDKDGTPRCDFEEGVRDKKSEKLMRDWIDRDEDFYPSHPVRIGDKWDIAPKLKKRLRSMGEHLGEQEETLANCTLKSVQEIKGHEIAEIEVVLASVNKLPGGIHVDMQATGTVKIDLDTGRVCRADLTGTVHASGYRDVGGTTISATGDGTLEMHQLSVPVS